MTATREERGKIGSLNRLCLSLCLVPPCKIEQRKYLTFNGLLVEVLRVRHFAEPGSPGPAACALEAATSGSDRFEIYSDPPSSRSASTRCRFSSGVRLLIRSLSRSPSSLNHRTKMRWAMRDR